jgi:hypothetical protein
LQQGIIRLSPVQAHTSSRQLQKYRFIAGGAAPASRSAREHYIIDSPTADIHRQAMNIANNYKNKMITVLYNDGASCLVLFPSGDWHKTA